jgi:hypothetical protein
MKTQETTTTTAATKSTKKQKASKPKGAKAKAAKSAKPAASKTEARAGSKKEIVLKLLRRDQGATIAEIARATDWQNHSIRGFLSAQGTKKMKLKVESAKNDEGECLPQAHRMQRRQTKALVTNGALFRPASRRCLAKRTQLAHGARGVRGCPRCFIDDMRGGKADHAW